MFRRAARRTVRSRDTLVISLALPILIMLLFVYVFGGAIQVGMPYLDYVLPGIILLCTGFGASITATAVSADMVSGAVARFRTLPAFRQALLAGHAGEGVVRNLAAVGVVLAVAFALGFRSRAGLFDWMAAFGVIALFVHAVTWIAVALGVLAKSPEAAGGFTYAVMFVPYISSAFVPIGTMPSWLRGFAENQPATPVIGTVRAFLTVGGGGQAVAAVLWCLGLTLLGYIGAAALYARR
ncbi:ABC transporter permease [Nocardia bhagyanarayanae]|uniref:Transport permease protein n=1 Tax=Nocardia bhagyanarayanae TaxID=1215925 RepID=A0A543EVI8_9NOCA|nr:ABC transporter permease [Nocardia bhagyanarayanae]TQM25606.1 ABC-2 type transport system permease protein [Nocardia bhagyanarayanae]